MADFWYEFASTPLKPREPWQDGGIHFVEEGKIILTIQPAPLSLRSITELLNQAYVPAIREQLTRENALFQRMTQAPRIEGPRFTAPLTTQQRYQEMLQARPRYRRRGLPDPAGLPVGWRAQRPVALQTRTMFMPPRPEDEPVAMQRFETEEYVVDYDEGWGENVWRRIR